MEPCRSQLDGQVTCPDCQQNFVCRLQAGYSSCWCFERPPVCPLPGDAPTAANTSCWCPTCLDTRIATQRQQLSQNTTPP